jgi:ferredoxin-NADP reductase
VVSQDNKLVLKLKEVREVSTDVYEYVFAADRKVRFTPGQYAEWTLPHPSPDTRGNRRYFTIASSPTERYVRIGVKFYHKPPSTFKKALAHMNVGDTIVASHIGGDFVLPRDTKRKLVFIAGGIGVTPFRSIVRHSLDTGQVRDIIFLYAVRTPKDIAYREILEEAQKKLGMKVIYIASDPTSVTSEWKGRVGTIDAKLLMQEIPDISERAFYISGPQGMVTDIADILHSMGVHRSQITGDYFPGF